jgi:hypothetical protein
MALKAADKDKLKALQLDVDKLIAAILAEGEVDFLVPEVTVLTAEQQETRDNTKLAEGKRIGETEGEKKGKELAAKALKKKFGIENEDTKDLDKVVELVNTKVGLGDQGLKDQVAALLKDKENLQGTIAEKEKVISGVKFDNDLLSYFPANRGNGLADDERLTIIKSKFQFETVDGKVVAKRDGQAVTDPKTHAPLPVKDVIASYFAERKWVGQGPTGGRGGDDTPPPGEGAAGLKTYSSVETQWLKDNPNGNIVSQEFETYLQAAMKDVPDFDMNK